MPAWWVWAYWLDPFSYAIQGLIANEFSAPRWDVPYNEFSSKRKSITLGQACLNVRNAPTHLTRREQRLHDVPTENEGRDLLEV